MDYPVVLALLRAEVTDWWQNITHAFELTIYCRKQTMEQIADRRDNPREANSQ